MINNNLKTAYSNAVFLSDGQSVNISVKGIAFGNAVNAICEFLLETTVGNLVVLTDDSGYFALVKNIRAGLSATLCGDEKKIRPLFNRLAFFSVDDGGEGVVHKLLASVQSTARAVVIGGEKLVDRAIEFYSQKDTPLLIVPVDYSFGNALQNNREYIAKYTALFFDDGLFLALLKNKVADVVRSVLSKRILFAEMRVNRLIGLDFDDELIKKLINESILKCGVYFKSGDYKQLVYAKMLSVEGVAALPFSDPTAKVSELLSLYDLPVMSGEREYLAYKLLAKIYSIALSSKVSPVKVPSYVFCADELKELLPNERTYNPLDMMGEDVGLFDSFINDEKLNEYIREVNAQIPDCERLIYLIYGGRKHTVEEYPSSVKLQTLRLAPLLCQGCCLLKAVWAEGFFELL